MLQCPRCARQFANDVLVCPQDHTPLQADSTVADGLVDPLLGRVFEGKYRLDERLGGGGMGTVYRATHLLIDRPVALKVLSQRFVGDPTAQQRFRREARAAGRMQHPNAVTVTDFGATDDGYLYIVMELLQGQTLRDLLAREAPLDPARAVALMLQASAAVGAAHEAGLVHRDLKPANIFIEQRANFPAIAKVLDFGVAKFVVEEHDDEDYKTLTQVGAIIGTPRYMSPEQCSGVAPLTSSSDVYSLGIILYEMLTGTVPFNGDTPLAIALKQVSEQPRAPQEMVPAIPDALTSVVLHALEKDPMARPRNANEFRRELFSTAQALGFEHADNAGTTTVENLKKAGIESPSGRLLIDLATLRQAQAASDAAPLNTRQISERPRAEVREVDGRRKFNRLKVPFAAPRRDRLQIGIAAVLLLIAILSSVVVSARWWQNRGTNLQGPNVNANAQANAQGADAEATSSAPTSSPTPAALERSRARTKRSYRRQKQPSSFKRAWRRVKGILP